MTTSTAAWRRWPRGQFTVSHEPQEARGAVMAIGETGEVAGF
ncbi:MAG: hypothetical protein ACLQCU_03105 [Acidimicrobiales bacterium]